jgi:hypothetical protein
MTVLSVEPAPCEHARCGRPVLHVQVFKDRGAPVDETLDAVPVSWEHGGRYRPIPGGLNRQMVRKLVTATSGFGVTLYRLHREVCEVAPRRTRQKTTKEVGS